MQPKTRKFLPPCTGQRRGSVREALEESMNTTKTRRLGVEETALNRSFGTLLPTHSLIIIFPFIPMFRLISINLHQLLLRASQSPSRSIHGYLFSLSSLRSFSELHDLRQHPFTVSYLQNSCGLPLEKALAASQKLYLENSHNPDSVLNLMRAHGLTQTQISSLISKRPSLLLADVDKNLKPNMELFKSLSFSGVTLYKMLAKEPRVLETEAHVLVKLLKNHAFSEKQIASFTMKRPTLYLFDAEKNLKPKLKYFNSLGFADMEIAKMFSIDPYTLGRSLENWIIPCIHELKRILGTDENVLKALRACYRLLGYDVEELLERNISIIVSHGVPRSLVLKMFLIQPSFLLSGADKISAVVCKVMKLGFDPNNFLCVRAIRTVAVMSDALWEWKVEVYRSYGLSTDEIYSAFKLQPTFMVNSEKKIRKVLSFFTNKLKMKPSKIAKNPNLMQFSLEKRIIPRCSVLQILMSEGLIREDISFIHALSMNEKKFVEKFVCKFQDVVPDVVKAHQGEIEFEGFATVLQI